MHVDSDLMGNLFIYDAYITSFPFIQLGLVTLLVDRNVSDDIRNLVA